ncbi:hypothetical protein [Halomarina pelagica]|uniref:hypothetical protein n=1 Tax=Halomarina pelagica TaxID=2961599 RepID=UPI0020C1FC61|nr:hypothetical protein [Halomarina sp. BND7]
MRDTELPEWAGPEYDRETDSYRVQRTNGDERISVHDALDALEALTDLELSDAEEFAELFDREEARTADPDGSFRVTVPVDGYRVTITEGAVTLEPRTGGD